MSALFLSVQICSLGQRVAGGQHHLSFRGAATLMCNPAVKVAATSANHEAFGKQSSLQDKGFLCWKVLEMDFVIDLPNATTEITMAFKSTSHRLGLVPGPGDFSKQHQSPLHQSAFFQDSGREQETDLNDFLKICLVHRL